MSEEDDKKKEYSEAYTNPYSFFKEPSKWFWWNLLERGRIHGDE